MRTLRFRNGDEMPMLGLGTWKSARGDVYRAVREAIRLGYRHIDCAAIYGNEREIGQALSECLRSRVVARDEIWITSKLWNDCHAPEHVRPALQKTLDDLQLDYLDLYLVHWPVALVKDVSVPETADQMVSLDDLPISVTWTALEDVAADGLCRHLGVSNFSIPKLAALLESARVAPAMNQVELHPYLQQTAMLDFCREHGVHLTAYAPLGSPDRPAGMKVDSEPVLLQDPTIVQIAARHGATPAQVLISWAIHRGTAVIPKSIDTGRLRENLAATDASLTDQDMREIAALDRHRRYVDGAFWELEGGPYTVASLWDE